VALARLAPPYRLVLDRTNWNIGTKDVNFLVLAVVTRRARLPVLWEVLDRGGGSSMAQCASLIGRFVALRNWIAYRPEIAIRTWQRIWRRLMNTDHGTIRVVKCGTVETLHSHPQRNQRLPRMSPEFHPRPNAFAAHWRQVSGGTGMDMGLDETTLRRIIARLVSFAALAERAAGRCFPVRWLVLAILRHAEGATLGYLADMTGLDWAACFEDDPAPENSDDDAAVLAWRFRTLAALLGALLPPDGRFDHPAGWTASREFARQGLTPAVRLFALRNGRRPAFHDTP